MTAVPAEFHSPVQGSEETEHDGAIRDLNAQRAIEEGESHSWVDVGESSLGCEAGLVREVDYGAGRAEVGERSGKSKKEVRGGNFARDRLGNTKLRHSCVGRFEIRGRCRSRDSRNSLFSP